MTDLVFTELAGKPVALVPLSNSSERAIIDAADAPLVAGRTWQLDAWGYPRAHVMRDGLAVKLPMHALLLAVPEGMTVDHRNRVRLDCRRSNLRPATRAQQQWNRGLPANNRSGFKGVSYHRHSGRWRATIRIDGQHVHLGLFDDPELAAKAYDDAARDAWGQFAGLNFERVAS